MVEYVNHPNWQVLLQMAVKCEKEKKAQFIKQCVFFSPLEIRTCRQTGGVL